MKSAVKLLTLIHILFLLLSSVAASFGGVYRVPLMASFVIGLILLGNLSANRMRAEREAIAGIREDAPTLFEINSEGVRLSLPLIFPTVALVFLVSYLTSVVLGLFGITAEPVPDAPLFDMLIEYALIPCIFEEMIFRYLPMKLIAPYSERWCLVLSSVYFALAHADITQIPYALAAGLIFIFISLMTKSVIPAILLHFLNNFISVLWIKYSFDMTFVVWYVIILSLGTLISLMPLIRGGRVYILRLRRMLSGGGESLGETYAPTLYIIFTLLLMLFNLFS